MKKNVSIALAVIVLGGLAAYLLWPEPQPQPAHVQAPPPPPRPSPKVEAPKVAVAPASAPAPAQPPLPALTDSDKFMLDALAGLVNNKELMKVFDTEKIISHIVATIDNLPSKRAPMSKMPIQRAQGTFIVAGTEDDLTLSPMNASRYTPYVKVAEAIDPRKLVELYVRVYPLFQQAYERLGYPKKYFNDRLLVVLDDLLDSPNVKGQVKLVQPNVFYQFADPDLEARSIGQRILMRIGSKNEAVIKAKLREIKKELMLQIQSGKIGRTG